MTRASSAAWTQPKDIKCTLLRRWKQGIFLTALVEDEIENIFPYRLSLKKPSSRELSENFDAVRTWIRTLESLPHLRLEYRNINHRLLGKNSLPDVAWVDSIEQLASLINCTSELKRFHEVLECTRLDQPQLLPWLGTHPIQALRHSEAWPQLLAVVEWLCHHPRPGIYLRQMDLPGVHTKFVESHRQLLTSLLDPSLPVDGIDTDESNFQSRYGFLNKPERIRFRFLEPEIAPFSQVLGNDLQIDAQAFAQLDPEVTQVFITENEINYLAFPKVPGSLLLFGSGYGFENLRAAHWLRKVRIRYWGDIDTHGFAILNQIRKLRPQTESLLMDMETLLAFRPLWGTESSPTHRELSRLHPSETKLYHDILDNKYASNLRLEQERIGFEWLIKRLESS